MKMEKEPSTAEKLAALKEQEKELKKKIEDDKKAGIQARKDARSARNDKLADVKVLLDRIQDDIHAYNLQNKAEKTANTILDDIQASIKDFQTKYTTEKK